MPRNDPKPDPPKETPAQVCERLGHDWKPDPMRGEPYAICQRCAWAP